MAILETHSLTKKFNSLTAVSDLTLEVNQGEVFGFLGPNGAGKTTTIRMLAGIIAATSGHAIVNGLRPDKEPERLHEDIGLLTETPGFYDRLSAQDNLGFFGCFYTDIDVNRQVEKYLKLVQLWDRRNDKAGILSKGMKQRLALARALLHEPKILFLDEPTAGLDPEAAHEIRQLITSMSSQGHTIFLSTHNLAEAESICHRIGIIQTRLLALDTPEDLRQKLFRPLVIIQLQDVTRSLLDSITQLPFVQQIERSENSIKVILTDIELYRPELIKNVVEAGGRIISVSEEQHSLEEVYLSLVRQENDHVQ